MKIITHIAICIFLINTTFAQRPETPVIDSVSVDLTTGKVLVAWNKVENIDGYIVYRQMNGVQGVPDGSFPNIATINSPNTLNYSDVSTNYQAASPQTRTELYKVATYKLVANLPEYSLMSETHSTTYLLPVEYDYCSKKIKLKWNKYIGWGTSLKNQRIYKSHQNQTPILLTRINAQDSIFEYTENTFNTDISFYIRTVNTDSSKTSTSNIQKIFTYQPIQPNFLTASQSTVIDDWHINLQFAIDESADIAHLKLIRHNHQNNTTDTIAKNITKTATYTFTDSVDLLKQQYSWYLQAFSTCNTLLKTSNQTNNIICTVKLNDSEFGKFNIQWNSYKEFTNGTEKYIVYRITEGETKVITETTDTFATDDINNLLNNQSSTIPNSFCYLVEAIEKQNSTGDQGKSRSNKFCTSVKPIVFLPNVFNPRSNIEENRTFTPKIVFAATYKLVIYNRWGAKVFETNSASDGWNGTLQNGEEAKEGTYIYHIQYTSYENETFDTTGNITLIYN